MLCYKLQSIDIGKTVGIYLEIRVLFNTALALLNTTALEFATNQIFIRSAPALQVVSFPNLHSIRSCFQEKMKPWQQRVARFVLEETDGLVELHLPLLREVQNFGILCTSCPLRTVNLESLSSVFGTNLENSGWAILLRGTTMLERFELPALQSVAVGDINIIDNEQLATLDLGAKPSKNTKSKRALTTYRLAAILNLGNFIFEFCMGIAPHKNFETPLQPDIQEAQGPSKSIPQAPKQFQAIVLLFLL